MELIEQVTLIGTDKSLYLLKNEKFYFIRLGGKVLHIVYSIGLAMALMRKYKSRLVDIQNQLEEFGVSTIMFNQKF